MKLVSLLNSAGNIHAVSATVSELRLIDARIAAFLRLRNSRSSSDVGMSFMCTEF